MEPIESAPDATRATRWTARIGLGGVTIIAAVASYLHALRVVQAADGRTLVAFCIPAVADLLIAAASANILDASRRGEHWPRLSVLGICVAVVVTLGLNVTSGFPQDVPSWLVNVWPPVAFILALESFMGHIRRSREDSPRVVLDPLDAVDAMDGQAVRDWLDEGIRAVRMNLSERAASEALGVSRTRVASAMNVPDPVSLNGDGQHGA